MAGFGGRVFLADLDADYITPSQACVNPLFNGAAKTPAESEQRVGSGSDGTTSVGTGSDRKAGAATLSIDSSIFSGIDTVTNKDQQQVARVTLNDCLACSGCVTSAETVLVTSHSISKLKEVLQSQHKGSKPLVLVLSVSPHARASIAQHYKLDLTTTKRCIEALFVNKLGFKYVFDTEGAARVAREEVAAEFLHRLEKREQLSRHLSSNPLANKLAWERPRDTVAISSTEALYVDTNEKFVHSCSTDDQPVALPLLTSSCPGWICYAEKKCPEILPYISTCKSPQQILGRVVKGLIADKLVPGAAKKEIENAPYVYHVTLMPCYDKKLEASRKDFLYENGFPDVDLVISPKEFLDMLVADGIEFDKMQDEGKTGNGDDVLKANEVKKFLGYSGDPVTVSQYDTSRSGSSGGYLDFTLRTTALKKFGLNLFDNKQILTFKSGRNKDFKVTEIQHEGQVVLRFAIAYGFRNIQAIMRQIKKGNCRYDFIEIMACPSGCLNGGAQLVAENRILTKAVLEKVKSLYDNHVVWDGYKEQVKMSDAFYKIFGFHPYTKHSIKAFHTTYHSVAELKLENSMGGDW